MPFLGSRNEDNIRLKMNYSRSGIYDDFKCVIFAREIKIKVREMDANELLKKFDTKAVIFDLDGTLLDNNYYHRLSWIAYLEKTGRHITEEEFNENMNGRTNKDAIEYIYGKGLNDDQILKTTLEKEAVYRKVYQPYIKPVRGLLEFLAFLKGKNIPMAIATSGVQPNIDFMFENVPIKKYFSAVVNSSHIKKGKPDPEIYLKSASLLKTEPAHCLVFEDAVVGIRSAIGAGMKVVALSTTEQEDELSLADLIIKDYTDLEI